MQAPSMPFLYQSVRIQHLGIFYQPCQLPYYKLYHQTPERRESCRKTIGEKLFRGRPSYKPLDTQGVKVYLQLLWLHLCYTQRKVGRSPLYGRAASNFFKPR